MAKTKVFETVVTFTTCVTCALPIALTELQLKNFRESGGSLYCVLGHASRFGEPESARLRNELAAAQDKVANLETNLQNAQRLMDAETKKRQRLMKRVENGVCPHCHRTFQQLARHMKDKHGAA